MTLCDHACAGGFLSLSPVDFQGWTSHCWGLSYAVWGASSIPELCPLGASSSAPSPRSPQQCWLSPGAQAATGEKHCAHHKASPGCLVLVLVQRVKSSPETHGPDRCVRWRSTCQAQCPPRPPPLGLSHPVGEGRSLPVASSRPSWPLRSAIVGPWFLSRDRQCLNPKLGAGSLCPQPGHFVCVCHPGVIWGMRAGDGTTPHR